MYCVTYAFDDLVSLACDNLLLDNGGHASISCTIDQGLATRDSCIVIPWYVEVRQRLCQSARRPSLHIHTPSFAHNA